MFDDRRVLALAPQVEPASFISKLPVNYTHVINTAVYLHVTGSHRIIRSVMVTG